jgi:hypothetical protein
VAGKCEGSAFDRPHGDVAKRGHGKMSKMIARKNRRWGTHKVNLRTRTGGGGRLKKLIDRKTEKQTDEIKARAKTEKLGEERGGEGRKGEDSRI